MKPREAMEFGRDLSRWAGVIRQRAVRALPGRGEDYLGPDLRDAVRGAVERLHPRRMQLFVREIIDESVTTKTFRFARTDGEIPPFRPGQYLNLFATIGGVRTSRPYSISSPPGCLFLDLTVRSRGDGFMAPWMFETVEVGTRFESTGPKGGFCHQPLIDGQDLVFLAGGSGVTPFMSMIRNAVMHEPALSIHLVYGVRTPRDVLFDEALQRISAEHPRIRVTTVVSEAPRGFKGRKGLLDAAQLTDVLGDVSGRMFFVCGPNPMINLCTTALAELGVPGRRIRRELFGVPADVTQQPGWPEDVDRGATFTVGIEGVGRFAARANEPLMVALERNGIVVPAVCRVGACAACRTRLLSGTVYQPPQAKVREADRRFGYIHACAAYPVSDVVIRL